MATNDVYLRPDAGDGTNGVRLRIDAPDSAAIYVSAAGYSAGTSTAILTAAAISTANLQAVGTSDATAIGAAISLGTMSAAGTSTVEGVGADGNTGTIAAAAGYAAGTSTVRGVGSSTGGTRVDYGGARVIRLRIEQQMDDEELMAIAAAMIPIIQADYMRQAA